MMIAFDPNDPFPLIDLDRVSYADQQAHSALVDEWLGLRIEQIESALLERFDREAARTRDERFWIGLPAKSLLTPYTEIRSLLETLNLKDGALIDLGAGYGRMGFVIARHCPNLNFTGIEVVTDRVREGSLALSKFSDRAIRLIEGDLSASDFVLPEADVYFLYDYGSSTAIEKTLCDLRDMSLKRSITVIGRGGASRDAIERRHGWLSQVRKPQHFAHFSIYRS
jgi:hypothetical protein